MSFPGLSRSPTPEQIGQVVNRINSGKVNATGDVTLTSGASSTTVIDARSSPLCFIMLDPLTDSARALLPSIYINQSNRLNGQFTITHPLSEAIDLQYRYILLGGATPLNYGTTTTYSRLFTAPFSSEFA